MHLVMMRKSGKRLLGTALQAHLYRSLHASEGEADKSQMQSHKWKNSILKGISIMDAVLNAASRNDLDHGFEAEISAILGGDPFEDYHQPFENQDGVSDRLAITLRPAEGSVRLETILRQHLPAYRDYSSSVYNLGCRPSSVVRYWLPAAVLLVCLYSLNGYVQT